MTDPLPTSTLSSRGLESRPAESFVTWELTTQNPLSGHVLAQVCRVCEEQHVNIHQLTYLAFDESPSVLSVMLDSVAIPEALLTLSQQY